MPIQTVSLLFDGQSLESISADFAETLRRRPELSSAIRHFLFCDCCLRPGLYELEQASDAGASIVKTRVVPSARLVQFAHAVSQGVIPDMPLATSAGGA